MPGDVEGVDAQREVHRVEIFERLGQERQVCAATNRSTRPPVANSVLRSKAS